MNDKIIITGKLKIKGWHNKACEILGTNGISTCIHCQSNNLLHKIYIDMEKKNEIKLPEELRGKKFRIRKLTPRECFRLMGVYDSDIDKIQAAKISNSSQYKLAGNSIVVDTLYHLFRKLLVETENENQQMELF